jgi:hypothetical protein
MIVFVKEKKNAKNSFDALKIDEVRRLEVFSGFPPP